MKKFNEIAEILKSKNLLVECSSYNIEISDISFDSREVINGTLFFAKGVRFKEEFLVDAFNKGALAYVSEVKYEVDKPFIIVSDIRKAMVEVARFFFDYPDRKLKLIGVTGTKGKSTVSHMIKAIIDEYEISKGRKEAAIISGIRTFDGVQDHESYLTSPEAIDYYRSLNNAVISGFEYLVSEVSSQALKYDRVGEVDFDVVALTNIGSDHIGEFEHPTIEDYKNSKLKIFDLSDSIVYYKTSEYIDEIEAKIKSKNTTSFDVENPNADVNVTDIKFNDFKYTFNIEDNVFSINLFGEFNILNAACAYTVARKFGISEESIKKALKDFELYSRSNIMKTNDEKIIAIVSYAHNKISFEKNFEFFKKQFPDYKIFSAFGGSGGKGLNRRKDLGEIASLYSDRIYFVPDDPNYDDTIEISNIIKGYFLKDVPYKIYKTREEGIIDMMNDIEEKTILFIAGKGDESFELFEGGHRKINSDYKVTKELIENYNKYKKEVL